MIFLNDFIMLLSTSIGSILLFIIFKALIIYDNYGYDYRGYNCYGINVRGKIDENKWLDFISEQDYILLSDAEELINDIKPILYNYNPFLDNMPSFITVFILVSINNIILITWF